MAISITADSLLSRPKLDYDVGYDVAVKGASVVVIYGLKLHLGVLNWIFLFISYIYVLMEE